MCRKYSTRWHDITSLRFVHAVIVTASVALSSVVTNNPEEGDHEDLN